jgi:D-aminopeptidase
LILVQPGHIDAPIDFRMMAVAREERTGRDFGDLVTERVVRPAGMQTALFVAETGAWPGNAVG